MPYSDLLTRAFEIVRRQRALWVMGFILALFGEGSSGNSSGSSFNWNTGSGDWVPPGTEPGDVPFPTLPPWATPENIILLIVTLVACLFLFALFAFVVRGMVLAGLIHGTERAIRDAELRWTDLLRAGWSQKGWRILGMQILLSLPTLLLLLLLLIPIGLAAIPFFEALSQGDSAEPAAIIGGILGMGSAIACIVLLLVLFSWVLDLIGTYAARAIVLENQPTIAAIGNGWRLLRRHPLDTFVFSILLGVIGIVVGLILGILSLVVLAIIGLPLVFLLIALELPLLLNIAIGLATLLFFILLVSALSGPLLAYYETAWTLAWQHLTAPTLESAAPLSPEPTLL